MDKAKLARFIECCKASGKDPQAEARAMFIDVINRLERNTPIYRLAWSKPIGFFVLHTPADAINILRQEVNEA